jgi:hypothetical protein
MLHLFGYPIMTTIEKAIFILQEAKGLYAPSFLP